MRAAACLPCLPACRGWGGRRRLRTSPRAADCESIQGHSSRAAANTATSAMDASERFIFDLAGYIVVKDVLSPQTLAAANAAVDAHYDEAVVAGHMKFHENDDGPDTARWDLRGMLGWPDRAPFVEMLGKKLLSRFCAHY
eukprot:SAG31_NODE_1024_length_10294_cov_7.215400_10_plen_140_part_00